MNNISSLHSASCRMVTAEEMIHASQPRHWMKLQSPVTYYQQKISYVFWLGYEAVWTRAGPHTAMNRKIPASPGKRTLLSISVSCLFGHYPSSNLIKFTTFQRLVPSQVIKGKGKKGRR
jgi:hypothetical protein